LQGRAGNQAILRPMDALIAGLLSGGFALGGVIATLWWQARREDARFRTETALELAELERLVWGDDWVILWVALQRQDARLAVARVPDDLNRVHKFDSCRGHLSRDGRATCRRGSGLPQRPTALPLDGPATSQRCLKNGRGCARRPGLGATIGGTVLFRGGSGAVLIGGKRAEGRHARSPCRPRC
jgi:hypothetical protein